MVTPSFSADSACVEHANHENYARAAVFAYWRHMSTEKRRSLIREQCVRGVLAAIDVAFVGATLFEERGAERYLGVFDLYGKFEAGASVSRWCWALLEMLVDPLLSLWVPAWVREHYERANPYFADVLRDLSTRHFRSNAALLRTLRREMLRRHRKSRRRAEAAKAAGAATVESSASSASGCEETEDGGDEETKAQEAAALGSLGSSRRRHR